MPVFYDQLNRAVDLPDIPKRIISVVPSQTELLFDLGLDDKITGITNFCTHPANKTRSKTTVGGTKKLDIDLIKTLNPDLIIANKEENDRVQIEELMNYFPVWISDINNLQGAVEMINSIGEMLDCKDKAETLTSSIIHQFDQLKPSPLKLRVAYLIWRKPYMVAGSDTFINSMLGQSGLTNAFDLSRYPEVNSDMLINARPDVIFLSSEPYPFAEKHITEFKVIVPNAKIILVDGEMFSWYGSRLLLAPEYMSGVIGAL
ncbi:substrate-binding protein [Mucilaginibacter mallensis]|uniref:Substrate-binding protein n=1 Tax=Mucilaginibacter mallensis TaxID=652787 RepID=A0A1H1W2D1_MUCMA|nr:helical backbone metal receptor [Mucilaginibacter mallensis]SDS91102.1 substrate-binding protein [Mucilaginibacter mallensis]